MPYDHANRFRWIINGDDLHYTVVEAMIVPVTTSLFDQSSAFAHCRRIGQREGYSIYVIDEVDGMQVFYDESTGKLAAILVGSHEADVGRLSGALETWYQTMRSKIGTLEDIVITSNPRCRFVEIRIYQQNGMRAQ